MTLPTGYSSKLGQDLLNNNPANLPLDVQT